MTVNELREQLDRLVTDDAKRGTFPVIIRTVHDQGGLSVMRQEAQTVMQDYGAIVIDGEKR